MRKLAGNSLNRITAFDVFLTVSMIIKVYITLYPFLIIVFNSISKPADIMKNPFILYPRSFYLGTYDLVLHESRIFMGFKNSVVYTVIYTAFVAFFTTAAAYPLSVKTFKARKFLIRMFIVPMFFSGGLIPTYLVLNNLGLVNKIWALILPGMVGTFNLILVRTFIEQLPDELFESAKIDGANEIHMFFKLVIPLSTPIIATISLWAAVGMWNNYFGPILYFSDPKKYNLQVILRQLIATTDLDRMMTQNEARTATSEIASMRSKLTSESLKAAVIVISTIPILVAYPFIQKYFVKGILIGAIKG